MQGVNVEVRMNGESGNAGWGTEDSGEPTKQEFGQLGWPRPRK